MKRTQIISYHQRTREPAFQKTRRGHAYRAYAFAAAKKEGKQNRGLTKADIVRGTRRKGWTELLALHDYRTKTMVLELLLIDSNQRNAESLRRMRKLLQAAEADARQNGMRKIQTLYTIITPQIAKRFGYHLRNALQSPNGTWYAYEKDLK